MKASKFLVSTAAAIAVAGTISLVYAQTGTPGGTYTSPQTQGQVTPPGQPAPANPSIQNQGPGQGGSTGSMKDGSTSTMGSGPSVNPSNDPGAMSSERVARADRN